MIPKDSEQNLPQEPKGDPSFDAQLAAELDQSANADRDALLAQRRARQLGTSPAGTKSKILAASTALLAGAALITIMVGPSNALKMLGFGGEQKSQATSQVDLEVEKQKVKDLRLDLGGDVPAAPEVVEERADPTSAFDARFRELEDKLIEVQKNKPPEVSVAKIQELLNQYNAQVTARMDEQAKRLQQENQRLREEAEQRDAAAKLTDAAREAQLRAKKAAQEQELKQRNSNGVVVDDSDDETSLPGSQAGVSNSSVVGGNQRFLADAANAEFKTSISRPLADPSKTVVQGTIISGVLETAINTELPGNIRAQVTEPVFSFDGTRILMPAGTVLIGTFNADVNLEQKRVLIAWNRAITPEGQSIAIGSTGADRLGRSGTEGNVNNRYMKKLGAAVLISTINVIPQVISAGLNKALPPAPVQPGTQPSLTLNVGGDSGGEEAATGAGQALAEQTSGVLERYLSLPPIISVPQGEEIRIFVNRDLVFR